MVQEVGHFILDSSTSIGQFKLILFSTSMSDSTSSSDFDVNKSVFAKHTCVAVAVLLIQP
jgi:hypothetical protein